MPELDIFLIALPAKKDLALADERGKVEQPTLDVLDEDLAPLEFIEHVLQPGDGLDPFADKLAAEVLTAAAQAAEPFIAEGERLAQFADAVQPDADLREQGRGFLPGVMFLKTLRHGGKKIGDAGK